MLNFDRRQRGTFRMNFEDYARTRVTAGRITKRQAVCAPRRAAGAHRAAVRRVALTIVIDLGAGERLGAGDMGKLPVVRVVATLAHDCRRTELFQGELLAALKILERGDLPLAD